MKIHRTAKLWQNLAKRLQSRPNEPQGEKITSIGLLFFFLYINYVRKVPQFSLIPLDPGHCQQVG